MELPYGTASPNRYKWTQSYRLSGSLWRSGFYSKHWGQDVSNEALAWVDMIYGKWDLDVISFVFNELLCLYFTEFHEIEGRAYTFDKNEDI